MSFYMIMLTSTVYNQSVTNFTTPPRFRCNYCLALQPSISTAIIFFILLCLSLHSSISTDRCLLRLHDLVKILDCCFRDGSCKMLY